MLGTGQGLQKSQKPRNMNQLVFMIQMRKVYWHVLFGEDDELPMRADNAGLCLARHEATERFS